MTPTGFPSAYSTGVPAGTTLKPSGTITVSQPGTVIDGLDVDGEIYVEASDVTIKNTRVTGHSWAVIDVAQGASNVTIQDVEVDGSGTAGAEGRRHPGSRDHPSGRHPRRRERGGAPLGIRLARQLHPRPCRTRRPALRRRADGRRRVRHRLDHNTIDITDHSSVSAVMIDNDFGPVDAITVKNSLLMGGSYTIYVDGKFSNDPITNVTYADNQFVKGEYGYVLRRNASVSWTNNTDHGSGKSIQLTG